MAAVEQQIPIGPPTPVTICQLEPEFNAALSYYKALAPKRLLEIGTASGGTLYHWLTNATHGTTVVSVDLPTPTYELNRALCHTWAPPGVTLHLIEGNSHEQHTIEQVEAHGPYGLIFIDGDHHYEDVTQDINNYWPMLEPEGLLMLHDISLHRPDESAGVWKAWRELQATGHWTQELRADRQTAHYGIGIVRGSP